MANHSGDETLRIPLSAPSSRDAYVSFLVWCGVAVLPLFVWLDRPVAEFFGHRKDSALFYFAVNVDWAGRAQYYLIPAACLYIFGFVWPKLDRRGPALLFMNVAMTGLAVNLLKVLLGRARPRLLLAEGEYGFQFWEFEALQRSFPSGHATTAFAAMAVLALLYPRYQWAFWGFAVFMGVSRIVSLEHYPSDIVAGAAIGVAGALVLRKWAFRSDTLEDA